jgi:Zn-dependent peptidase ImmA (M78 family)/transcriptional regulator with XRE-family HTH domain
MMTTPEGLWTDQIDESFNPSRLKLARERRGLTKQQLADLCGVSRRTVTSWETGDTDSPPVATISKALGFPRAFFFEDDITAVNKAAVSFRALSTVSAYKIDRVLAMAKLASLISRWMDRHYKTPAPQVPDFTEAEPRGRGRLTWPVAAAESLRAEWALGPKPIKNVLGLLERHGVRVFSLPGADREVDAFSYWEAGRPFIFLNVDRSAERMRFDLAHELGHLLLHRGVFTKRERRFELEANDFASAFLVPEDSLRMQITGRPTIDDLFTLKAHWRVSAVAMAYKLHHLDLISEWIYRTWMIELTERGFRAGEPGGRDPEPSVLLRQLLELAREDGWTPRKIAADLSLPEDELSSIVFGLTMRVLDGGGQTEPAVTGHLRAIDGVAPNPDEAPARLRAVK